MELMVKSTYFLPPRILILCQGTRSVVYYIQKTVKILHLSLKVGMLGYLFCFFRSSKCSPVVSMSNLGYVT